MKRLTKDAISNLPDIPTMEYEIEAWGVSLLLQGISKKMQIELGRIINDDNTDAIRYQKELLKACVVDPELDDDLINELYSKDSKIIDQIFLAINDLNGIGENDNESVIEEFQD